MFSPFKLLSTIVSSVFVKGVAADAGGFAEMRNTTVVFLLLRDRFDDLADFCTRKRLTCFIQFFLAELPEQQDLGAEFFDHFLLLATAVDGVFFTGLHFFR